MQKLDKNNTMFYCFPKFQNKCLIYSTSDIFENRLFKSLSIQISSKNSLLFRLRTTKLGHLLYKFVFKKRIFLNTPSENIFLGYRSGKKIILFEFDSLSKPINVFKKNTDNAWEKDSFIGFQLIEEYSKKEYFKKKKHLLEALNTCWNNSCKNKYLHGDFTHFNILLKNDNKPVFIDEKKIENSLLFDIFYFQSYYFQCLENCKTICKKDVLEIKQDFKILVKSVLNNLDKTKLAGFINSIDLTNSVGIKIDQRKSKLEEFRRYIIE